jgi:hypothetical protein
MILTQPTGEALKGEKEKLLRELPRTPKSLKQEVMGNPLVNPIIRNYKKS